MAGSMVSSPAPATPQTGAQDEHAAHHSGTAPPAAMAGSMGTGGAPAANNSAAGGMAGMMGGEGCCGGQGKSPFFSQLLAPTTPADHSRLMSQAFQRLEQGRVIVAQVASTNQIATDRQTRQAAANTMREGADMYVSGAAALAALDGTAPQQQGAINWFRDQMRLDKVEPEAASGWFGLSPSHLLLMLFLGVVSALLIALQAARLRRVSKLAMEKVGAPAGSQSAKVVPMPSEAGQPAMPAPAEPAPAGPAVTGMIPPRKARTWKGQLRVVQIVRETPTVQTFRLADLSADRLPFDFLPGQFLQVEVEPADGKAARRSYTIASSPTQHAYVELTVKREEQGVVSRYLHDQLKVGELLTVTGPFGAFTFTGTDAESIVLIAGGVGITPMMSVLRYLTDTGWPGKSFSFMALVRRKNSSSGMNLSALSSAFPNCMCSRRCRDHLAPYGSDLKDRSLGNC
jgi:hypothetical protein